MPTQHQVDCIASFVEACGELEREPFYGKDEKLGAQTGRAGDTYIMGDRFHFRSALISFRRIWMPTEASSWSDVVDILGKTGLPSGISGFAASEAKQITQLCAQAAHPVKQSAKTVIDLWLNTVFAHGGVDGKKKAKTRRADFEAAVKTYGHAAYEYAFRLSVKWLGIHFMNLSRLSAKPALAHFQTTHGLEPSFKIGAAFGIRRRERTPDGHIIIRQGSSEFFSEETMQERFERVLERHTHQNLKFVFDHLDVTKTRLLRAVIRADSFPTLIGLLEGELRIKAMASAEFVEAPGLWASAGLAGRRINVYLDNVVETHPAGAPALDTALAAFRRELIEE
jgi:hypothetical protein